MAEMRQETDYVKHHIQKVVAFFLSMRNFSEDLIKQGHQMVYYTISDVNNPHSLEQLILENQLKPILKTIVQVVAYRNSCLLISPKNRG